MGDLLRQIVKPDDSRAQLKRKNSWLAGQYRSQAAGILSVSPLSYPSLNFSFSNTMPFSKTRKGSDIKYLYMKNNFSNCDDEKNVEDEEDMIDEAEEIFEDLSYVDISNNSSKLMEEIIKNLTSCTKLLTFKLSHCEIKTLPKSFQKLQLLTSLDVSRNQLKKIPKELFSLQSLKYLNLSQNEIKIIPENIKSCNELILLDISGNTLKQFPFCISELYNLEEFLCFKCGIKSLYPKSKEYSEKISSLPSKLKKLDIHSNYISNLPSNWISGCNDIQYLDLSFNELEFLPECIGYLHRLGYINLRSNKLMLIPPSLSRLHKQLKYIYLDQNPFKTPPKTYNNSVLHYFSGILPGQYYDAWFLQIILKAITNRQWSSKELTIIGQSVSGDLFRRHIQKSLSEAGG